MKCTMADFPYAHLLLCTVAANEGCHFAIASNGPQQSEALVDGTSPGPAYQLVLSSINALKSG